MELLDDLLEGAPLDELHHVVGFTLGVGPQLVDGDDAGVFELAGDLGLDAKPHLLVGALAQHPLQRDRPADDGVFGQPDLAHPPLGEELLQDVVPATRLRPVGVHGLPLFRARRVLGRELGRGQAGAVASVVGGVKGAGGALGRVESTRGSRVALGD